MGKTLGELLKKARLEANLSLTDVARLTDMPTGQISMIETGVRPNPGFLTIVRLAKGLKVSLDALASQCEGGGGAAKSLLEPSDRAYLFMLREIEAASDENEKLAMRLRALLENPPSVKGKKESSLRKKSRKKK